MGRFSYLEKAGGSNLRFHYLHRNVPFDLTKQKRDGVFHGKVKLMRMCKCKQRLDPKRFTLRSATKLAMKACQVMVLSP